MGEESLQLMRGCCHCSRPPELALISAISDTISISCILSLHICPIVKSPPTKPAVFLVKECAESPARNVMIDPERRDDRILSCIDHIVSGQSHTNILPPRIPCHSRLSRSSSSLSRIWNSNRPSLLQGRLYNPVLEKLISEGRANSHMDVL